MEKTAKKEIQAQYKDREIIGGVYAIKNTRNNKLLVDAAVDIRGSKNRFEFAQKTGSCVHPKLQDDWTKQAGKQFEFQVLDELKKGEAQSMPEFKAEIELMKQIRLQTLPEELLY